MSDFPSEVFRAYDIRGLVETQITTNFMYALGQAFGERIRSAGGGRCVVGYDARHSGPALSQALAEGLARQGIEVAQLGAVASPVVYWAAHRDQGHGVMVTGSHNPAPYNGFKLVLKGHSIHGEAVTALRQRMMKPPEPVDGGRIIEEDWTGPYQADLWLGCALEATAQNSRRRWQRNGGSGFACSDRPGRRCRTSLL